jgi:hypothetical protein
MHDLSTYDASFADLSAHSGGDWPAAIAAAAYGYTRSRQFSPVNAMVFGVFGYVYPLTAALALGVDALFIQEPTPLKHYARDRFQDWKDKRIERYFKEKREAKGGLVGLPRWAR